MKKPDYISLKEFSYPLSDEKIAKYPLPERDNSKLLLYRDGSISENRFSQLPLFLPENPHLVFNETRVIHARLKFRKKTGAHIEIFCLEPLLPSDYQINFSSTEAVEWKCLVGNLKKWKNEILEIHSDNGITLYAELKEKEEKNTIIRFSWSDKKLCFSEIIDLFGNTPIPPYLNREAEESDSRNYQTVYSKNEGSVAAPTAGLHFTPEILDKLKNRTGKLSFLNLHVGAGTFVPVKTGNAAEHRMHIERVYISRDTISRLLNNHEFILPVGTTSCRSLESMYWIGEQILHKSFNQEKALLEQWTPYEQNGNYSRHEILEAILHFLDKEKEDQLSFSTGIMITPGYKFKMTDALITNFHQPSSTLLMLIAALVGENWKKIYSFALENDFRFLSYGDSSLLYNNQSSG